MSYRTRMLMTECPFVFALGVLPTAQAQAQQAPSPPASSASHPDVATKKPAKPGVQSGAASGPRSQQGQPTSTEPAASSVATKKPAKPGSQSGAASAPGR